MRARLLSLTRKLTAIETDQSDMYNLLRARIEEHITRLEKRRDNMINTYNLTISAERRALTDMAANRDGGKQLTDTIRQQIVQTELLIRLSDTAKKLVDTLGKHTVARDTGLSIAILDSELSTDNAITILSYYGSK